MFDVLSPPIMEVTPDVEIRVVWGLGVTHGHLQYHNVINAFNSYLTSVETMRLSCTILGDSKLFVKSPIFTYTTCI